MNTLATNYATSPDFIPTKPRQRFNAGWDAFVQRRSHTELTTQEELHGYWAALDACAYAETNQYLVKTGKIQ